jgi:hypothetical protein
MLVADHDCRGPSEIGRPRIELTTRCRGADGNPLSAQPGNRIDAARHHDRYQKDRAKRRANDGRRVRIGALIAHDHQVGTGAARGPDDRAEVSGLLDRLDDADQRATRFELQVVRWLSDDGHDPVRSVAVRDPLQRPRTDARCACPARPCPGDEIEI